MRYHSNWSIPAFFFLTCLNFRYSILELTELCCGRACEASKTPIFSAVATFINKITHWVAYEVLSQPSQSDRIRIISFFLETATVRFIYRLAWSKYGYIHPRTLQISIEHQNFNAAWAVFGAFNLHPVSRLRELSEVSFPSPEHPRLHILLTIHTNTEIT